MQLAVYLSLALAVHTVVGLECKHRFTVDQWTGSVKLLDGVTGSGSFHADVNGYYYKATLNDYKLGRYHIYKDFWNYVVCYEKTQSCVRNKNEGFAFPRCVPPYVRRGNIFLEGQAYYDRGNYGESNFEQYYVILQANGTCVPVKIYGRNPSLSSTVFLYSSMQEDEPHRNSSFYKKEISAFSGLGVDDILG